MLGENTVTPLKEQGVKEVQLFTGSGSDLYIGFNDGAKLQRVKKMLPFPMSCEFFIPQKGSDMGNKFKYGLCVPFALMDYKISKRSRA